MSLATRAHDRMTLAMKQDLHRKGLTLTFPDASEVWFYGDIDNPTPFFRDPDYPMDKELMRIWMSKAMMRIWGED